jgi:hypothetical protein
VDNRPPFCRHLPPFCRCSTTFLSLFNHLFVVDDPSEAKWQLGCAAPKNKIKNKKKQGKAKRLNKNVPFSFFIWFKKKKMSCKIAILHL